MAQDNPNVRSEARSQARIERQQIRAQNRPGPVRVQNERVSQPRPERIAQPRPVAQPRATARQQPAARGGFGGDVVARAQAAQRAQRIDQRSEQRADRVDRRSEQRAAVVDRRSERQANRIERRGDIRADRLDQRGREIAADRVDRRTDRLADRVERRGDIRADRIENRGNRRADRIEDRGDRRADRIDGRRGGFGSNVRDLARDGRRDDWRGDRRDDWRGDRRSWRRDDWRHGWNGRPGWDNRDFRRWNNGWRGDRRYDWNGWRRSNQFLFRPGAYYAPFRSHRYSRVDVGFYLDSLFFQPRFFINDPWQYRLPPAYGPYQWVRYYDDVALVDIYTGEVVDVIHGFFW
ncbi:hypothetical protein C0V72_00510 [Porphyrobacter sp. TH134]|nr:hypothetical protein C0V72_00510 [Porphyrobacter sp. TH134]